MKSSVRATTLALLSQAEEGALAWEVIARCALAYMSEADVKDMAHCNDLLVMEEEEE